MDFRGQIEPHASRGGVVADGRRTRYPARHIPYALSGDERLNLGGTADSYEFVPKQGFGFVRGFLFSLQGMEETMNRFDRLDVRW